MLGNTIKLRLGDALYNAGLLGFIKICNTCDLKYEKNGDELIFYQDILENFTQNYLNTMIKVYGHETIYQEIMNRYQNVQSQWEKNNDDTNYMDEFIKYISSSIGKMERASYKAAYTIIQSRGEEYNFLDALKQLKKEKEAYKRYVILCDLIEHMKKYKDVFMLKDITYTKIDKFWSSVAFLNSSNNKKEFNVSYTKTFTDPAKIFVSPDDSKKNIRCCQCDAVMKKSQGSSLSWINDLGIDMNRKQSNYWDFNVDTYLCPICYLIYSCMPLGFTVKGSAGIFINQNTSIDAAISLNQSLQAERNQKQDDNDLFYRVMGQFIQANEMKTAEMQTNNIQIIRREDNRYIINILSKNVLKHIKKNSQYLDKLVKIVFPIGEGKNKEYLNIYREIMDRMIAGRNLYDLIHKVIYEAAKEQKKIAFMRWVMTIQGSTYKKGEIHLNSMTGAGQALRKRIEEDKIRGLSFRLLNCLKTQNQHDYLDTLLRQYIAINLPLPEAFKYISKDDDKFLDAGYAFLVGLNSESIEKTQDKNKGEKE